MRILVPAILMLLFPAVLSAQRQVDATGDIQAVLLVEGTQSVQKRERIASRKGRSGVTASKQYFIFGGSKAAIRTRAVTPVFQFDADPAFGDPGCLFRLDMRSDSREIRGAKSHVA